MRVEHIGDEADRALQEAAEKVREAQPAPAPFVSYSELRALGYSPADAASIIRGRP